MKAFLCHSSVDKAYVETVARRLGRARVQYDAYSFEPGVDFRDAIKTALRASTTLVLFASRNSLASSWVQYELDTADQLIRQGILRSAVTIIIDDYTSVSELPLWMRQARVERIRRPSRATRLVTQHLHRLSGLEDQPLFIGREAILSEFAKAAIGLAGSAPPRLAVISGLPGTGRRTFLQHGLKNILSLDVGPVLILEHTDGVDTLHASLVDELGELAWIPMPRSQPNTTTSQPN